MKYACEYCDKVFLTPDECEKHERYAHHMIETTGSSLKIVKAWYKTPESDGFPNRIRITSLLDGEETATYQREDTSC